MGRVDQAAALLRVEVDGTADVEQLRDRAAVAARAANVKGVVIVEIGVAVDGTVTKARVLRSIPLLDDAALTAVRQWRYEPARRNGQAIEATHTEGVYVGPPSTP